MQRLKPRLRRGVGHLLRRGWRVQGVAGCDTPTDDRYRLEQGKPASSWRRRLTNLLLTVSLGLVVLPAQAECAAAEVSPTGFQLDFVALAPGLWLIPGAAGDADAGNRGQVSNLLLAFDGPRTWLLGSGPSPAFGRVLACAVQARFGRVVSDGVSPWPRPELVLGLRGLPGLRAWAHADVAQALRSRCPGCVERLRQRLGPAAVDLGEDPVQVPDHLFEGQAGTLGPWRWRLLSRGEGFPVTVWEHRASGLRFAPGLLWGVGAPDGRDADLSVLSASTRDLLERPGAQHGNGSWVGEQGPPMQAAAVTRQARYWPWLLAAAHEGVERGDDGTQAPDLPADLAALGAGPQHALNWQRAWRQAESRWLQRSLR